MANVIQFNNLGALAGATPARMDSQEGLFMARELEQIDERIFENAKPALNFLDLLPVKSDVPMWAAEYTYSNLDSFGKADWIGDGAKDLPVVNAGRSRPETSVFRAGGRVGWREDERLRKVVV